MRARALVALPLASAVAILALSFLVERDDSREPLARATSSETPNVLVIVTDDQRALDTFDVMPNTRRLLMEQGLRFTNAHATTPLCCPARASIFTGQLAHNHGVYRTMEGATFAQKSTVQFYLRREGYRTAIFGKYLNGWDIEVDPPYFDEWAVFSRGYPRGYSGATWNVDGSVQRVKTYSTSYVTGKAIQFLGAMEAEDSRPWLLFVSPFAPHMPSRAEEQYRRAPVPEWDGNPGVYERDRTDKPPYVQERNGTVENGRRLGRKQLRTLMSVDDLVSRLFGMLEILGESQNTLAFFLSDNGYAWGEHGVTAKLTPYAESTRIPLLLRWPGRVAEGREDDHLAAVTDVAPTILDAAGIDSDRRYPMDGVSLLKPVRRERLLLEFWRMENVPTWASTRTPQYQYVEYYNEKGAVTFREYYDLIHDPWQLENLLGDRDPTNDPDVGKVAALLARDRRCVGTAGSRSCP